MNKNISQNSMFFLDESPIITAQMHEHAIKVTGLSGKEIYTNPKKLVNGIISVYKKYNFNYPVLGYDVYNIEAEALGQEINFIKTGAPQLNHNNNLIKSKNDFKKINIRNIDQKKARLSYVIEATKIYTDKTGITPPLQFTAPFSLAAQLYGIEKLLMKIMTDPGFAEELFSRVTNDVIIPWIKFQKEKFPKAKLVLGADALTSPPNLSICLIEKFVVPYIKKIKNICGPEVGIVNWWGDSYFKNPKRFFQLKQSVSPNNKILRIQDPDLAKLNIDKVVNYSIKNNMSLTFGFGASFLTQANLDSIKARASEYVEKGKKAKNFTLYLCNISKDTPEEKIYQVINSARNL